MVFDEHPVVVMVLVGLVMNLVSYVLGMKMWELLWYSVLVMLAIVISVGITVAWKYVLLGRVEGVMEVREVSTHTAGSVAGCISAGWLYGGYIGMVLGMVMGMVFGYSRVYIGRHAGYQVAYGYLVGLISFVMVVFINKYYIGVI